VRAERWHRLLPGVYLLEGTTLTVDVWRRAALLWAGPTSVLSHRSGAEVWRLDNITDTKPELLVAGSVHPRSRLVTVHRVLHIPACDVRNVDTMRVTSPARTIIDLAAVLDASSLRVVFESARRRRLTTVEEVQRRLRALGTAGRSGGATLTKLLTALHGRAPSEFPLEVKVAEILGRSRLPQPVTQHEVAVADRVYRLDFAWPASRVGLECDGRLRHSEDSDFRRDRNRWSDIAAEGWRLLFATWEDTRNPARLVERLETALRP
jgi:hypothetical protein